METKSKALIVLVLLLVLTSAALIYYRTMIVRDFEVTETVPEDS